MSEFSKNFLRERIGDEKQPREFFGAFGKHPGWDDHIEDLPLPTASMATAKQLLYVQGIGSQISSGAWTRLAEDARLPGFDHVFLWLRGRQFLAGRMWASSDGKRRAHFPMIVLMQGINVPIEPALDWILGQLETVAAGVRAANSAEEVREVVRAAWGSGREVPEEGAAEPPRCTLHAPRAAVVQLATDFRENPRTRFPADAQDLPRSLRFWSRVCTALAPADAPLLFLAPCGEPWLDVLAGEPGPEQFFCLRAGLSALPLTRETTPQDSIEELDADELIKELSGEEGRSWISRFLRH